jgi:hypothetical protein
MGRVVLAGVVLGVSYLALVSLMMFLNCNVLSVFSWLVLSPLLPGVHHRLITDLLGRAFKCYLFWAQVVGGLRPVYYGEGVNSLLEKDKKSKLIIGNHLSFVDGFCLVSMGHAAGEVQVRCLRILGFRVYGFGFYGLGFRVQVFIRYGFMVCVLGCKP